MNTQGQFNFETATGNGYSQWITSRQLAVKDLARRVQLPINRKVEVWLQGGIRLRGKLKLKGDAVFLGGEPASPRVDDRGCAIHLPGNGILRHVGLIFGSELPSQFSTERLCSNEAADHCDGSGHGAIARAVGKQAGDCLNLRLL